MAKIKKSGLGKGLDVLFADNNTNEDAVVALRLAEIEPNRDQPRRTFDETALAELADSIREHGVIQPLIVRPMPSGVYQIIAGERRWRASRMAGLSEVPVIVRELSDEQAMELALIENLQREDLNAIEEAQGYQVLMQQYGLTQEQVAAQVGKSRPVIANALRLLNLPDPVLQQVRDGALSAGHARALLSIEEPGQMLQVAQKAALGLMTVRDIERMGRKRAGKAEKLENHGILSEEERFYKEAQIALEQELGRRITIQGGKEKGILSIEFYNREDLQEILDRLGQGSAGLPPEAEEIAVSHETDEAML